MQGGTLGKTSPVRRGSDESGFTLLELLIVMIVLGILGGITTLAVGSMSDDATEARCRSDVRNLQVANAAYKARTGSDAPNLQALIDGDYLDEVPESGVTITNGVTSPATQAGCVATEELALTPDGPTLTIVELTGTTKRDKETANWSTDLDMKVVDQDGAAVGGAVVDGTWSDGTEPSSCTSNPSGRCTLKTDPHNAAAATWTLDAITKSGYDTGASAKSTLSCTRSGDKNGTTTCS